MVILVQCTPLENSLLLLKIVHVIVVKVIVFPVDGLAQLNQVGKYVRLNVVVKIFIFTLSRGDFNWHNCSGSCSTSSISIFYCFGSCVGYFMAKKAKKSKTRNCYKVTP